MTLVSIPTDKRFSFRIWAGPTSHGLGATSRTASGTGECGAMAWGSHIGLGTLFAGELIMMVFPQARASADEQDPQGWVHECS